jgi:hypothetical protein
MATVNSFFAVAAPALNPKLLRKESTGEAAADNGGAAALCAVPAAGCMNANA